MMLYVFLFFLRPVGSSWAVDVVDVVDVDSGERSWRKVARDENGGRTQCSPAHGAVVWLCAYCVCQCFAFCIDRSCGFVSCFFVLFSVFLGGGLRMCALVFFCWRL
jgi:hypothetical protein